MKRRRQQKREFEKYKQQIVEKHLQKIKRKEELDKKKEQIIEFSTVLGRIGT